MHKVWIEAALTGPRSRSRQPGISDTVAEGIACAGARHASAVAEMRVVLAAIGWPPIGVIPAPLASEALRVGPGRDPDSSPLALRCNNARRCSIAAWQPPMPYRERNPCVYILASRRNGTLYVGVTSDLFQRMPMHKQGLVKGFTKKYRVHMLVYYESHPMMEAAIRREKQVKEWRRLWKIRLIESMNPEWIDLFDESTGEILDGPADVSRRSR